MSLSSNYVKRIADAFGKTTFAAWYPDAKYSLGDYGLISDNVLVPYGNLRDLGIRFDIASDTGNTPFGVKQSREVSFSFKAAGEAHPGVPGVPLASAGIGFQLRGEGAFVIVAPESYLDQIDYYGSLGSQISELVEEGRWDPDFRVVVQVRRMPLATVLISESRESSVEFSLGAIAGPTLNDLCRADLGSALTSRSAGAMVIGPAVEVGPIMQLARPARPMEFKSLPPGSGPVDATPHLVLEEVNLE
jgi:hypothetical protein